MRGVDHQLVRLAALGRKRREDAVEDAEAAPADEPVVDCLVGAVVFWSVAPASAIADHEDYAADDASVRGTPSDCGKYGSIRR
jgi:hypothetical protein